MFTSSSHSRKRSTLILAGWLFADLLLGLWAFSMVASPAPIELPTPTPSATATLFPSQTPTLFPTRTFTPEITFTPLPTEVGPVGLGSAQCYNIELAGTDPSDGSEEYAIIQQLKGQIPNDTNIQAGLVLVWAHGVDILNGRNISMRVNKALTKAFPLSFGEDTAKKSMGFQVGKLKHVQVEVYFFTNSPWQSGLEKPCEFVD